MTPIFQIAILAASLCLGSRTVGEEVPKENEFVFSYERGTYSFVVKPITVNQNIVSVTTTFRPAKIAELGRISEEAAALGKLLPKLRQRHLTISHFYIPTTFELEVRERIQAVAINSDVWLKRTPAKAADAMKQMISSSKAYNDLQTVLSLNGFEIKSISVENIFAVSAPKVKVLIPQTWTTFITVKQLEVK